MFRETSSRMDLHDEKNNLHDSELKIYITIVFSELRSSWITKNKNNSQEGIKINFYILMTVHLSIILDNDQLDAHLLYFTIRLLQSSTCFEHYMLIIRRLNCIDAASGIVTLS